MVHALATVTLTATATQLSTTSKKATWVQITGSSLSGTARIGDSTLTSTTGATLAATGDTQFFPAHGNANAYDLSAIYVLGTPGDTLQVTYNTN